MENYFTCSHQTNLLSILNSIFSNEHLFVIMSSLVELKKREIESKFNLQRLYISQVELNKKAIEKEIAHTNNDLMHMR